VLQQTVSQRGRKKKKGDVAMQYRILQAVLVAALIVGLWGCAAICGKGAREQAGAKAISLSDVPAPARATIERLTAGGEIKKLERAEEEGKVIYDVEGTVGGKTVEYDVASDGTVLTSEASVPYASLPQVVRAAAEKYFGSAEGLKASRELEKGQTFYEVEGKKGGATRALKLTDKGKIIEEE
jgi:uncharacterized membrane protein YkoI